MSKQFPRCARAPHIPGPPIIFRVHPLQTNAFFCFALHASSPLQINAICFSTLRGSGAPHHLSCSPLFESMSKKQSRAARELPSPNQCHFILRVARKPLQINAKIVLPRSILSPNRICTNRDANLTDGRPRNDFFVLKVVSLLGVGFLTLEMSC